VPEPLSARNPRIADLRRLSGRRRARLDSGLFVVEGPVVVAEALVGGAPVREVFIDADVLAEHRPGSAVADVLAAAERAGLSVRSVAAGVLAGVADTVTPQGVVAIAERRVAALDQLIGPGPVLVLAGVADPGNAGTLVRTAEAAGAAGVLCCAGSVDLFGPKAVRAGAGSLFRMPVAEAAAGAATTDALAALRRAGRLVVATEARGGSDPATVELGGPIALVVGSEAHGLDPSLHALVELSVTIPMAGTIESLNASVAGAVVLFEAARQRRRDAPGPGADDPTNQLDDPAGSRQAQRR